MRTNELDLVTLARRIRRQVLDITYDTRGTHLGSSFSCVEILAALYFAVMRHTPEDKYSPDRDRFLLSKGHACLSLFCVLAERGFMTAETLQGFAVDGGTLEHHSKKNLDWGIEISAGSLGHGLGLGAGMALAGKFDGRDYRTYVLLSDGELDEGTVWEAALFAAHHRLNRLVAIVDYNKIQALGRVEDVMGLEPLVDKWRAFGWNVIELDGHDFGEVVPALTNLPTDSEKPSVIIAHTVKGKGVSFMEDSLLWHYRCPDEQEVARARAELDVELEA